jgi:hypothetical protein
MSTPEITTGIITLLTGNQSRLFNHGPIEIVGQPITPLRKRKE